MSAEESFGVGALLETGVVHRPPRLSMAVQGLLGPTGSGRNPVFSRALQPSVHVLTEVYSCACLGSSY